MIKTILHRLQFVLMLLLSLSGIAGVAVQGKTIEKPVEEVGICPDSDGKLKYVWHNKEYNDPGKYTIYENLPNGDREKYTLNLYDKQLRTIFVTMRKGTRVTVLGKDYTAEGTYYDTIFSPLEDGCDTVVRLTIKNGEFFHQYDTIHKCQGDPWPVWHGQERTAPGTYYDPVPYYNHADSIYQLTLIEHYDVEYEKTFYVCSQDVYYLNGRRFDKDADWDFHIKSQYGCDSTIHAHIRFVEGPKPVVREVFFCDNISIIRHGTSMNITEATSVFDTVPGQYGCDSIIETRYTPYPSQLFEETQQIYVGKDRIDWRGKSITQIGVYHDSLKNQYECDSIYRLRVIPKNDIYLTVQTCAGEKVELLDSLGNEWYVTHDTIIIDSLKNAYGGDSLIHTTYNFVQPFYQSHSITICSNQYVKWKGHIREGETEEIVLHEAGEYHDAHRTMNGCDSIYTITVTVLDAYNDTIVFARCNDSIKVHPITWRDSKGKDWVWSRPDVDTIISDTMRHTMPEYITLENGNLSPSFNSGGCDSIQSYRIVTGDFCSEIDEYYFCKGGSFSIDGKTYKQAGFYADSLYSPRNLGIKDSIHNFRLIEAPTYEIQRDPLTLRRLQLPYKYEGIDITKGGLQTIRKTTQQHGCDSIIKVNVTIIETVTKPVQNLLYCPNENVEFKLPSGRIITEGGKTYYDTIYGVESDTIIPFFFKWAPTHHFDSTAFFRQGESFIWTNHKDPATGRDYEFTEEDVYWDKKTNMYGCDSIYRLELKEAKPFYGEERLITLCENDLPYLWHGRVSVTKPDIYYDSLKTVYGLDSVWKVEIKINKSYDINVPLSLCPNEKYTLSDGTVISGTETTYWKKYYTTEGCDSIVNYYINRPEAVVQTTGKWFKQGTVYTWTTPLNHTILCDHAGHYFDTLRSVGKCDSIIYELNLTEEHEYFFSKDTAVCLSNGESYLWHGIHCSTSDTYYDRQTTWCGLDSVYELHLTVNRDTLVQSTHYMCPNGTLDFFGYTITEPKVYRATFPREKTGCDSIVEWIVQYVDVKEKEEYIVFCEGDSKELTIGGSVINVTESGVYRDTIFTDDGFDCKQPIAYYVTVARPFFQSEEKFINPGSSYKWHKNGREITLTEPNTYWDSCKTVLGCDSVYKLVLRHNQKYIFPTETASVCSADLPYVWRKKNLTETKLYYDSLKTKNGLDSIYSIYLTVNETKRERVELNFCKGEVQNINAIPYKRDTAFTDTLQTHLGCDSIVDYVLHFRPTYKIVLDKNLQEGQSYQLGDTTLKTSGEYRRILRTKYGCDSTVTVRIKTCPNPQELVLYYNLCEGEEIKIGGETITNSATIKEHLTAADGCDSLVTHIVNVHAAPLYTERVSICVGDAYTWKGHRNDTIVKTPGVYEDAHKTKHGCDSIYRLIVNYKHTDVRDTVISICAADRPYTYKGKNYFNDSVFADTLGLNKEGCDSILRWNYRINYHCSDYVQYNRCTGQIINIDGLLISKEGAYEQRHITTTGQDSLYRFIVHDVQNYEFYSRQSGCDSIVYDGKTYYARGKGRETFNVDLYHRTVDGCDSLEHLELTIHQSSPKHVFSKTIADYDSVRFGPYWYKTTGVYALQHENIHGCDSTEELNLTVLETAYPEVEHYFICYGDPRGVEIFGRRYHPAEDFTRIVDTTWIDSKPVIRTADITVQHPFIITSFDPQADQIVCSDHEIFFDVNYTTVDRMILPDYYEVDFLVGDIEAVPMHQDGNVNGKTTITLRMGGQGKYVAPGYYKYRIKLRSEVCERNDTVFDGSIVIRYPDNIMESAWNDVVMLVNEQHNGGSWVFRAPYQWQVISAQGVDKTALVVDNATQPYLYSSSLEEGDRITATLYREGYGRPVPSCEYIFKPTLAVSTHAILLYPSAVKAHMPVTISSPEAGSYRLLDNTGHLYTKGEFSSGETQVIVPVVQGCYIMVLEDENGRHQTHKLIVY